MHRPATMRDGRRTMPVSYARWRSHVKRFREVLEGLRAHRLAHGVEQPLSNRRDRAAHLQLGAVLHARPAARRGLEVDARRAADEAKPSTRVDAHGVALSFNMLA